MRKLTTTLSCLLILPAVSSSATSPPPPPAKYVASWKAIDALEPFMGDWSGTETQHVTGAGVFQQPAYWQLKRLGGQDVILLEHGYGSLQQHDKTRVDQFDVPTFSPDDNKYKMYLPGYRLFRDSDSTGQLITVERPNNHSLSWASAMQDGRSRRTTLSINGVNLTESVEILGMDGSNHLVSDAVLQK